jgi:hypothetical protein
MKYLHSNSAPTCVQFFRTCGYNWWRVCINGNVNLNGSNWLTFLLGLVLSIYVTHLSLVPQLLGAHYVCRSMCNKPHLCGYGYGYGYGCGQYPKIVYL